MYINKIMNWNSINDCFPRNDMVVILRMKEGYRYEFANLHYLSNEDNSSVTFLTIEDDAMAIDIDEVEAWTYVEL